MKSKIGGYTPLINTVLDRAKQNDVYAIVRIESNKNLSVGVLDGQTKGKKAVQDIGVGISVFTKKGASGFASTDKLYAEDIKNAVDRAANLAKSSENYSNVKLNKEIFDVDPLIGEYLQETKYDLGSKSSAEIEELVNSFNMETKNLDERISVETSYSCSETEWRIARTDGTDVIFNVPRSRIFNFLTLKEGDKISELHLNVQGLDYSVLLDEDKKHLYDARSRNSVQLVSDLLNAGSLPGGNYKALLSYDFAGLYAHEAVGHAFETDALKRSIVGDENGVLKKGEKVAPDNISFVDGPVEGLWGNHFISSNGVKRKTVEFIKDGVILDALSDVFSAKESEVGINGCGRAESYNKVPICRMSVTRMVDSNPYPFDKDFEDVTLDDIYDILVKTGELKSGEMVVYPVVGMGGQVMPVEGTFVFNCAGIYTIENPKKITLYKQSLFSGSTLETIATRTRGIGKENFDGAGVCGKGGQSAPCSKGGNTFFVIDKSKAITFGGE